MQVKLFKTGSDPRKVNKGLNEIATLDCKIKHPFDIVNPTIIIDGNYLDCNYFYIPSLERYYFANPPIALNDKLCEISGHCDVLSSFDVLSLTATVERQEFKRNSQIVDNEIILQSNNNFICQQVGNAVNSDYKIYLTTCGGEV